MGPSVWFSYFPPMRGPGGEGGACSGRLHRQASPAALHFTVKSGTLHGTERGIHTAREARVGTSRKGSENPGWSQCISPNTSCFLTPSPDNPVQHCLEAERGGQGRFLPRAVRAQGQDRYRRDQ